MPENTLKQVLGILYRDLTDLFGNRLRSLILFGPHAKTLLDPAADVDRVPPAGTLAFVDGLAVGDLVRCAARTSSWKRLGLAVPLFLTFEEFTRSLDVFPLEYGEIIATHVVVAGANLLQDVQVDRADLRRACEVQAKSHLIHLREGYLETEARPEAVARLIADSAGAFAALLRNVAHLHGLSPSTPQELARQAAERFGLDRELVSNILALEHADVRDVLSLSQRYADYLAATKRLWELADEWVARS